MYVAFDGIDGAGKTTLISELLDNYPRIGTRLFKLPRPEDVRFSFRDETINMLSEESIPAEFRIQDRSILTTIAYYSLEVEHASDDDIRDHLQLYLKMVPKIIFYLDYPPELAWARKSDMFTADFIKKVYNEYERAIELVERYIPERTKIIRIDARRELNEKLQEVINAVS